MKVYLYVDTLAPGVYRVAIGCEDKRGVGHGYRITGDKYGDRASVNEQKIELTRRDAVEIRDYLRRIQSARRERRGEGE